MNIDDTSSENIQLLKLVQDIEFLQLLVNPNYLSYLNKQKYFEDQDFLSYLTYLEYLKSPIYKKFIFYTKCYEVLDMLNSKEFRNELSNGSFITYLQEVLYSIWKS